MREALSDSSIEEFQHVFWEIWPEDLHYTLLEKDGLNVPKSIWRMGALV